MANLTEVSEAVIERVSPVLPPRWTSRWFKPAPPPVPGLYVCPDPNKHADYQVTHSRFTQWFLRLELYATATDRQAAHRVVGELTDPGGCLIRTLLDEDIRDSLWDLCGQNVVVTDGKGWKLRAGRAPYLTTSIGLQLGAN